MSTHGEAAIRQPLDFRNVPTELKDSAALLAMEVVMVRLAGRLVNRPHPGKIYGHKPTLLEEGLNRAIHRGNSQTARLGPRSFKNLRRGKRPLGSLE